MKSVLAKLRVILHQLNLFWSVNLVFGGDVGAQAGFGAFQANYESVAFFLCHEGYSIILISKLQQPRFLADKKPIFMYNYSMSQSIFRYQCKNFAGAISKLESLGVASLGGILLTDYDFTLTDSLAEIAEGSPEEVDTEIINLLRQLELKNWKIAVVTNNPGFLQKITDKLGNIFGYKTIEDLFKLKAINKIFSGGFNYKKTGKSVQEVGDWCAKVLNWRSQPKQTSQPTNVVMIGDELSDIDYGTKVYNYLSEKGYDIKLLAFKLG